MQLLCTADNTECGTEKKREKLCSCGDEEYVMTLTFMRNQQH